MTLIKSISGIRGTLGGVSGENLTPIDVVKYTSAYGSMLLQRKKGKKVVVGRDARISGPMVHELVVNTLMALAMAASQHSHLTHPSQMATDLILPFLKTHFSTASSNWHL